MHVRLTAWSAVALTVAACGGGSSPSLGYRVPGPPVVTYGYGDTTIVTLNALGQSMEIAMRGAAEYVVSFSPSLRGAGVGVALTVDRLTASIEQPMSDPIRVDTDDVTGALTFTLDARGNAIVGATPNVAPVAARMISGLGTAHTFFPGLPNRAVSPGDEWVDTVSYGGDGALGATTETSVMRYVVVGPANRGERSLLEIGFTGTTELSNSSDAGGMRISQTSALEVEGTVLWDEEAGLMYEMVRTGSGPGTLRIPISPVPLPIAVTINQHAVLRER